MDQPSNHSDPKPSTPQPLQPLTDIKSPMNPAKDQVIDPVKALEDKPLNPVSKPAKSRAKKPSDAAVVDPAEKRQTRSHGKVVETPKQVVEGKTASNKGRKKKEKAEDKAVIAQEKLSVKKVETPQKTSVKKDEVAIEKGSVKKDVLLQVPAVMEKNNEKTSVKKESTKKESVVKEMHGDKREREEEKHEAEPAVEKKVKVGDI